MSKADRKAAIQAEIARRERESGVPPNLHVYTMRPQQADERGPRGFSPVEVVWRLRDRKLVEEMECRLLDAALREGKPIELVFDDAKYYVRGAPPADYCEIPFGRYSFNHNLLIFSRRAADALRELLEPCCRRVPVSCKTHDLIAYQFQAVEDVLDAAKTDAWWNDYRTREYTTSINRYSFFTDKLGKAALFTVPQNSQLLALQAVVDVVRQHGLNGFVFRKVWPYVGVHQ